MDAADSEIEELLAQHAIKQVLYRYCRGIDRRDFELVRSCYHPDATDDHGKFRGSVDGFIDYVSHTLTRFERTMHNLGNIIIERDGDIARSEAYAVAYHRLPASEAAPQHDYIVGLRYLDRIERRDDTWAIANRVCAIEWSRMDEVVNPQDLSAHYTMGVAGPTDPLYAL
jgi:3-phenylpropionate/cinnamic acid dioxygenase small subunit